MRKINYSVYLVTEETLSKGRTTLDVASRAIDGGATIIQFREKLTDKKRRTVIVRELRDLCTERNIPFIINDSLELAREIGADGIHLGQCDESVCKARELFGSNMIIGVSVTNKEEARAAFAEGADYLGAGTVFSTKSKEDSGKAIGLTILRDIVKSVPIPVVAIGGITIGNLTDVLSCGVSGIAVISAITAAEDPAKTTVRLCQTVQQVKRNNKSEKMFWEDVYE